jgi:lipid-A-disaccharide synthase-like uncharacterized protein
MLKDICARTVIPVAIAVTGFVVVCCLLLYSMIRQDMVNVSTIHGTNLADTLTRSARYAMLNDDREALGNLIANVGAQEEVEHVRIFNKKGRIAFSSDPREVGRFVDKNAAGCISCHAGVVPKQTLEGMQQARTYDNLHGDQVLAVTASVFNESTCTNTSCHAHSDDQAILGILDVGLDQESLRHALASLRWRMMIFTLMILCLTIGGVVAILNLRLIVPFRRLMHFTEGAANGNIHDDVPHLDGELGMLVENIYGIHEEHRSVRQKLSILLCDTCINKRKELIGNFPKEFNENDFSGRLTCCSKERSAQLAPADQGANSSL